MLFAAEGGRGFADYNGLAKSDVEMTGKPVLRDDNFLHRAPVLDTRDVYTPAGCPTPLRDSASNSTASKRGGQVRHETAVGCGNGPLPTGRNCSTPITGWATPTRANNMAHRSRSVYDATINPSGTLRVTRAVLRQRMPERRRETVSIPTSTRSRSIQPTRPRFRRLGQAE